MSSSWTRTFLQYALMLIPALVLSVLVVLVVAGASVTGILRDPARFADAPRVIRTLTRAVYWHTRKHWHTIPDCVQFDAELLYRPRPGECVFENAEFRTVMHFDERGARLTPNPVPAAAGTRHVPRLVIVGDSHAMGWGVDDHETFASMLAGEHGYWTANFAVSSYGTPRELLRLNRDFELAPDDIVIIQYCDNDFAESRQFATRTAIGPYRQEELQHLLDYRPARVSALPIAGVLLRLTWKEFSQLLLGVSTERAHDGPDPTTAFLRVLAAYPELRSHRVIVVAINGPSVATHLSVEALAAVGIQLILPDLSEADFFDIDDHMRPAGHRRVASALDAAIRAPAPLQ